MDACPCGGKRTWTWHTKHDVPQCDHSKTVKKAQSFKNRNAEWVPGSYILVPEHDPL